MKRGNTIDRSAPNHGKAKSQRVDLGLDALSAVAVPGVRYSQAEIAAWCGCSQQSIDYIERQALKKLKFRIPRELLESLI